MITVVHAPSGGFRPVSAILKASSASSAVYLGDGVPIVPLPAFGHHAETEIHLSTDLEQIQIHAWQRTSFHRPADQTA